MLRYSVHTAPPTHVEHFRVVADGLDEHHRHPLLPALLHDPGAPLRCGVGGVKDANLLPRVGRPSVPSCSHAEGAHTMLQFCDVLGKEPRKTPLARAVLPAMPSISCADPNTYILPSGRRVISTHKLLHTAPAFSRWYPIGAHRSSTPFQTSGGGAGRPPRPAPRRWQRTAACPALRRRPPADAGPAPGPLHSPALASPGLPSYRGT